MMKYENAELEIIGFAAEDVLATSNVCADCPTDMSPDTLPDDEL